MIRFAFPAITPSTPYTATPPQTLSAAYGTADRVQDTPSKECFCNLLLQFCEGLDAWLDQTDGFSQPLFRCHSPLQHDQEGEPFKGIEGFTDLPDSETVLCLLDPCHLPNHPSWILRNALALAMLSSSATEYKVLPVTVRRETALEHRLSVFVNGIGKSLRRLLSFSMYTSQEKPVGTCVLFRDGRPITLTKWHHGSPPSHISCTTCHLTPSFPVLRKVNLRSQFDPKMLAEEAIGLNIRLMLWRAAPSLDLDTLVNTRCALIGVPLYKILCVLHLLVAGMGTLGCHVARCLLGWGVRHLSVIDCGRVSFSNPVRQCLYEFEDCLEDGKPKAVCAAEHLRRIHPSAEIQSYTLKVPMPGHPPLHTQDQTSMQHV